MIIQIMSEAIDADCRIDNILHRITPRNCVTRKHNVVLYQFKSDG